MAFETFVELVYKALKKAYMRKISIRSQPKLRAAGSKFFCLIRCSNSRRTRRSNYKKDWILFTWSKCRISFLEKWFFGHKLQAFCPKLKIFGERGVRMQGLSLRKNLDSKQVINFELWKNFMFLPPLPRPFGRIWI